MILKGRLKTDFLFQTTFFIGIYFKSTEEGKREHVCVHYFGFDRGG